jgi:hypothetical protein
MSVFQLSFWFVISKLLLQVELYDLLGNDVEILSSFPVCNSWVHTINGILWPAPKNNLSAVPQPVPGGSLDGGFIAPTFPNPTSMCGFHQFPACVSVNS